MGLIPLSSRIFIEISDREDSNWIYLTNLPRVFLSDRKGFHESLSSCSMIALWTNYPRITLWMKLDSLWRKCLGLVILLVK